MDKHDFAAGIEQMRTVARLLTQWAEDMEKNSSMCTAEAVDTDPAADAAAPVSSLADEHVPSLPEIKAFLAAKCAAGFSAQVKAIIASFGATSLSSVPPAMYGALMEAASVLGGDADAG